MTTERKLLIDALQLRHFYTQEWTPGLSKFYVIVAQVAASCGGVYYALGVELPPGKTEEFWSKLRAIVALEGEQQ